MTLCCFTRKYGCMVRITAVLFSHQIGVSYNLSNVSIYVVDLKKVAPFGDSSQSSSGLGVGVGIGGGGGGVGGTAFQHGQSFRKSFNRERPPGGVRQNQIKMKHDTQQESDEKSSTETEDDGISTADIKDLNHYHNIFQPRDRECKFFSSIFPLRGGTGCRVHRLLACRTSIFARVILLLFSVHSVFRLVCFLILFSSSLFVCVRFDL